MAITNIKETKEAVQKFAELHKESYEANAEAYRRVKEEFDNMPMTEKVEEFAEIATILSLPDDKFALLAPVFLEEMAKIYNDPAMKIQLAQAIGAQGLTVEEAQEQYAEMINNLNGEEFKTLLSDAKIDFMKQLIALSFNALGDCNHIVRRIVDVPIQVINENAKIPVYAHPTDAGMDVYALEDITIAPGETKLIPIGIKVALPTGYELQVRPKSGRCLKTKLRVANAPGTIDAGYRDEIGVIIDNIDPPIKKIYTDADGKLTGIDYGSAFTIGKGEKFAQLVLANVPTANWVPVTDVNILGENRNGGFGSTGLK